jgi:hypothetical protein
MIFNGNLIFIHIGKTGGMSCSEYLLNNLQPPVYNCHADALKEVVPYNPDNVVPLTGIGRHSTLVEALEFIAGHNGKTLEDFQKVIAVVRHPYSIEYSYYQHLQKPHIKERRRKRSPQLIALAEGDFRMFVEQAGYHRDGVSQDSFFRVDGEIPERVELLKFEELSTSLPTAIANFRKPGAEHPFPHRNKSKYPTKLSKLLTPEVEELIYQKHKFMFDSGIYQRTLQ